jgi:formate hydrogenlyase subunit 3/multisubunit Na+/H+ antiporter MnhD subunit
MFIAWIFFCIAAAMFASIRRNRSAVGWFVFAFFFSPLIAFVFLAILKERAPDDLCLLEHEPHDYAVDAKNVGFIIVLAIVLVMVVGALAQAQQQATTQQVFRDASGRTIGTATQSGNQTTFRDASGRTTGTVTAPTRRR